MKQLILAVTVTLFAGSAVAQSPSALVHSDKGTVQVQAVAGNVQVGGRTVPTNASVGVNPGDVITATDGTATVTYANGCAVTVTEQQYTVADKAPVCKSPSVKAKTDTKHWAAAGVGAAALVAAVAGGGGGDKAPDKSSSP